MMQKLKNLFWHPALTFFFALTNNFPAQKMTVIGVTGTKGKSSVAEMLYEIFKSNGHQTALVSGIHFAYPGHDEPNLFKMTMPGRGFIQKFLARARRAGATHAIVEITSEGAVQSRHRFLYLNGLVVTNIHKEHIEAHGSFENYVAAKRAIVRALEKSPKAIRALVVNGNDKITQSFLNASVPKKHTFEGAQTPGDFHDANVRAALALAEAFGISKEAAQKAVDSMPQIKGRVEPVECGQNFKAIVDYAHTPDSLIALYESFPNTQRICVLGNTGGGRDTWKRPLMGKIAEEYCETVILTNEDPYNEDPEKIIREMAVDMKKQPLIILDRREAIREAVRLASLAQTAGNEHGAVVLISGKGTDPYIMEKDGVKTPWSDVKVVREELERLLRKAV